LKALIVDAPAQLSPIKLRRGLLVKLSILVISLKDVIVWEYILKATKAKSTIRMIIQGTTIAETIMILRDRKNIIKKEPIYQPSCISITYKSLENLFKILPIGVTSK